VRDVPAEVCDSRIDALVTLDGRWLCTGDGKHLSLKQLREVVDVYNAWRVGNLQDCTLHGTPNRTPFPERPST